MAASPSKSFPYVGYVDAVNGTQYKDVNGYRTGEAGNRQLVIAQIANQTATNGKLTLAGWALVNGGQDKYFWSVDGKNWTEVTDIALGATGEAHAASATGAFGLNAVVSANGLYNMTLDLSAHAGKTVTVYVAVRSKVIYPEGSVLISCGNTKVICNATVEESVPPFLKGQGKGWVTAEYNMLPRATASRSPRDISKLKLNGRSAEIQRLIGRALRSVVDLEALGERSITIDCDVIQADGGTRCASITGAFCALVIALDKLKKQGVLNCMPLYSYVAAVSVGIVNDEAVCDLDYVEDSGGEVDFNFIMDDEGNIIELQGTGEERPFSKKELDDMYVLAQGGIKQLVAAQKAVVGHLFR